MANKLRSGLTILGMLIGVASVIILIAVGTGSSQAVQKRIESLGTNVLLVLRGSAASEARGPPPGASMPLTRRPMPTALSDPDAAPDVQSVSPVVNAPSATLGERWGQLLAGAVRRHDNAPTRAPTATRWPPERSSRRRTLRAHSRVVVLGQTVVDNLFAGQNPVGQSIQVNGDAFQVIGVTSPKGSNGAQDQDDIALAPLTAVEDTLTGFGNRSARSPCRPGRGDSSTQPGNEVTSILDARHHVAATGTPDFRVINQGSLLATSSQTSDVFTTLLGAVAAISLLVAGIGVMNIMLVTVTERTREIGIRKAIGARKSDILTQFLVEAVLVSVFGGVLGVGVGVLGSQFQIAGVQPVIETYSLGLAFGVAVVIGLFFGSYPASRAASMRPIEALRYE